MAKPELTEAWLWLDRLYLFFEDIIGRIMTPAAQRAVIVASVSGSSAIVAGLGHEVATGAISLGQWETAMRLQIKNAYIQQYLSGIGGVEMMGFAEYGSIGGMLTEQYGHLNNFAEQIAAGKLSEAEIIRRSEMYMNSSREAYERANARARGVPQLPQYPGDGNTQCLTNCACYWDIITEWQEGAMVGWNCYWTLSVAEHCQGCLDNNANWSPLFVPML